MSRSGIPCIFCKSNTAILIKDIVGELYLELLTAKVLSDVEMWRYTHKFFNTLYNDSRTKTIMWNSPFGFLNAFAYTLFERRLF